MTPARRTQSWTLDSQGNWQSLNQTGFGSNQTRAHDAQNRITGVNGATATSVYSNGGEQL